METAYANCQSCGMPLKRDEKGGGTNEDGSKSTVFCSHCYQNGRFVLPDVTANEMQQLVKAKLKEFHIPGFLSWFFTRNIPSLERWKTNP